MTDEERDIAYRDGESNANNDWVMAITDTDAWDWDADDADADEVTPTWTAKLISDLIEQRDKAVEGRDWLEDRHADMTDDIVTLTASRNAALARAAELEAQLVTGNDDTQAVLAAVSHNSGYDAGREDGESDANTDWVMALTDAWIWGDDADDITPSSTARLIVTLTAQRDRARTTAVNLEQELAKAMELLLNAGNAWAWAQKDAE